MVDQPATIGALPVGVARATGHQVAYLPGLAMRRIADLHPGRAKTDAARSLPHPLRQVDLGDNALAELEVLVGFDDDLATETTRISDRHRPRAPHRQPTGRRDHLRARRANGHRPSGPGLPATGRQPENRPAATETDRRRGREDTRCAPPLRGPAIAARHRRQDRRPHPARDRRRLELQVHRTPDRPRRHRPRHPQLRNQHQRRTPRQNRQPRPQTRVLPRRVRLAGRPNQPRTDLPRPAPLRRPLHHAPQPHPLPTRPDSTPHTTRADRPLTKLIGTPPAVPRRRPRNCRGPARSRHWIGTQARTSMP